MTTIRFQPYAAGTSDAGGNRIGSIAPRLSRTNYFDGQLLKASDLTRDQVYLDERLLEMGQVLGSGIVSGLQVDLTDNHILIVSPGIAVAPSGRVLQLSGTALEIDLQDSGFIADRNKGKYRRFNRGLYAIALKYTEVIDSIGEAYPVDLAARRQMQAGSYAEGVELALIPLNLSLPSGDSLAVRAALAQQIIGRNSRFDLATDEAVALGLIAIDQGRPLWLDSGLLRRPLRSPTAGNTLQQDLATHYRELFDEVVAVRRAGGRQNDFSAGNYFRLLPPFGPLPKASIDPVGGRQSYFPKDYDVTIAPVRRADLPSIIEESAHLAPMDLERDADADIMILVPMSNQAFALRARQLENMPLLQKDAVNRLPLVNGLALRLFARPPAHLVDTDADAWKAIWDEADPDELVYVRRPPRTAETNVSAVVLARGFALPPVTVGLPPDSSGLAAELAKVREEGSNDKIRLAQKEREVLTLQKEIDGLKQAFGSDTLLADARVLIHKLEAELAAAGNEIKILTAGTQDISVLKTALEAATDKIRNISVELELSYKKINELQSAANPADEAAQKKIQELVVALDEATRREAELQLQLAQRSSLRMTFSLVELAKMRGGDPAVAEKLEPLVGDNVSARLAVIHLLTMIPVSFDKALWPSLLSVAQRQENLPVLRDITLQSINQGMTVGQAFIDNGESLGMSKTNISSWKKLVL